VARPRLGRDVFRRGAPERFRTVRTPVYQVTLFDLLKAYAEQHRRKDTSILHITANELFTVDEALKRLRRLLGRTPDWQSMAHFLPPNIREGLIARSALASTFMASLELARSGKVQLRQNTPFGPIYLRAAPESSDGSPRAKGLKSL
jgi:segregation and condensation protein A